MMNYTPKGKIMHGRAKKKLILARCSEGYHNETLINAKQQVGFRNTTAIGVLNDRTYCLCSYYYM